MKKLMNLNLTPEEMADRWGAPFVRRDQKTLDRAIGGTVNARTTANEDSRGTGPEGKVYINGRVAYHALPFFQWLADRIETRRAASGAGEVLADDEAAKIESSESERGDGDDDEEDPADDDEPP